MLTTKVTHKINFKVPQLDFESRAICPTLLIQTKLSFGLCHSLVKNTLSIYNLSMVPSHRRLKINWISGKGTYTLDAKSQITCWLPVT